MVAHILPVAKFIFCYQFPVEWPLGVQTNVISHIRDLVNANDNVNGVLVTINGRNRFLYSKYSPILSEFVNRDNKMFLSLTKKEPYGNVNGNESLTLCYIFTLLRYTPDGTKSFAAAVMPD